jgi:3-hydroxyisobutyrate dehydrogenase
MIDRLRASGADVTVWERRATDQFFLSYGALVREVDIVVTMVGTPRDVEDVYFGPDGILRNARAGQTFIDMTTSSPELAQRISEAARAIGAHALDAPVSGGPFGAEQGSLSVMVGGDADALEAVVPVLDPLAGTVVHQGAPGSGQLAKLLNQLLVAAVTAATGEVYGFAKTQSLDGDALLASMLAGAAGSPLVDFVWRKLSADDFEPGYRLAHLRKDLDLLHGVDPQAFRSAPLLQRLRESVDVAITRRGESSGSQGLGVSTEESR